MIECYFDGACEPMNPGGHAGWGAVILVDNQEVWYRQGYCGYGAEMSNNVAEYSGLIGLLTELKENWEGYRCARAITIKGDSLMVVNQMAGRWKVKKGLYMPYYRRAFDLAYFGPFPAGTFDFQWVPRELNARADELSKLGVRCVGMSLERV